MNAILCPIVAHKLKHLENLAKMQALLIGNNVQGLIEIVSILAIFRSGNVAGCINGASVALKDYAGRHIIFGEIDNGHAVVDFCKPLILKLLHNGRHFVLVEGFAVIAVERYSQKVVDPRNILERQRFEPLEKLPFMRFVQLDAAECGTCFILKRGVFFGLLMEFDIECNKFADGIAVFDFFSVAPFVICNDHFSELRSPITEVIDADGLVAQMVKDTPERISENRCCDMVDTEGLCDVYGRIIQADILSAAFG